MSEGATQIVLAILAFGTGAVAWFARIKIADSRRQQPKQPSEVLFEGYEKLLKRYQEAIHERDSKVLKLESAFEHVQLELNKALSVVSEMKIESKGKDSLISGLENQLQKMKEVADLNGSH